MDHHGDKLPMWKRGWKDPSRPPERNGFALLLLNLAAMSIVWRVDSALGSGVWYPDSYSVTKDLGTLGVVLLGGAEWLPVRARRLTTAWRHIGLALVAFYLCYVVARVLCYVTVRFLGID